MAIFKRGKDLREGVRQYIDDRIKIAKNTAKMIEERIRTGEPTIIRPDLLVGIGSLSEEFGTTTKKERIKAVRKLVEKIFPEYKEFERRRIIQ